jgi:acetyl-CoA C-acetyltransferase
VDPERTPVLVGVAQLTQRDVALEAALSAPDMLERVARAAVDDAGAGDAALRELDAVGVVAALGWRTLNPPQVLADRVGAASARAVLTAVGGDMPLRYVDHCAREIEAGRMRSAIVCGTHNLRTLRRASRANVKLDWETPARSAPETFGENKPGNTDLELAYKLDRPSSVYPIFENALRARRKLSLAEHQLRMGRLMHGFTRVAAENPHAWFPTERSATEIATPARDNRMIAFPYTKYLNSVMETDQAAAVWITSAATARRHGVPASRWIHYWGGAAVAERAWFPSERPDFAACPASAAAARGALARAGTTLDAVDSFDFYSCFPVAVELACEQLGLEESDPRGFTVTGGLPYAGGPGNNYTLHSLAAMVERLRARPGSVGLVTGNGWYLTKHSAVVCSSAPPEKQGEAPQPDLGPAAVPPIPVADGAARLETYTILYDREGAPERGIAIGRLDAGGERFIAHTPASRAELEAFAAAEQVGRRGRVRHRDGHNLFEPE